MVSKLESTIEAQTLISLRVGVSEVFFKIKSIFLGYFDPVNILLDNKNK